MLIKTLIGCTGRLTPSPGGKLVEFKKLKTDDHDYEYDDDYVCTV